MSFTVLDSGTEVKSKEKNSASTLSTVICSDQFSLRAQLLLSFTLVTIIAAGITLGISLGLLYALGDSASTKANSVILANTQANAGDLGKEIAASIGQQLTLVGESVCKVSALYSSLLLTYAQSGPSNSTLLAPQLSYREYYFDGDCSYPNCPTDYGPIAPRSRIPYLPGFINGSLDASSMYLYSSSAGSALRNNSAWDAAVEEHSQLQTVIDGLAYQDLDFKVLYNQGPSTTVMFYLSAQVFTNKAKANYFGLHRTYPGILKNDTAYDPSRRGWFLAATTDGIGFNGPYRETFTKQIVVTLSSRKTSTALGENSPVTIVAAAVMLVQDVAKIVQSVNYTDGGFGALITYQSNQVLVWGNDTNVYETSTNSFKTLSDFDSTLGKHDLTSDQVIEYTSAESGINWIVTVSTLFTSDATQLSALVMLVFAQKHEAQAPLRSLDDEIDSTTSSLTTTTVIIVFATVGAVMAFVFGLVVYLTQPLEVMRSISGDVVRISAEEPHKRDYTAVLGQAGGNLRRTDEAGVLATSYYHVICMLHNKTVASQQVPKNPTNPFHVAEELPYDQLTWRLLHNKFFSRQASHALNQAALVNNNGDMTVEDAGRSHQEGRVAPVVIDTGLDVLAALAATQLTMPTSTSVTAVSAATQPSAPPLAAHQYQQVDGDIELGKLSRPPQTGTSVHSGDNSTFIEIAEARPIVGICTSIKSQLYFLAFLLLAGMMATLIMSIVSLADEGDKWTETSSSQLQSKQMMYLQAMAASKVVFVNTYFQQLSLDLLVGAQVYSLVNDKQLNRSSFITDNLYLPSYAIDPRNPYHLPNSNYSLNNTGYFVSEDADCFRSAGGCDATQTAYQTRLTSLLDIKLRSYFYTNNAFSFWQTAEVTDGFTRYLPYSATTTNSNPTSCVIAQTGSDICTAKYTNSRCASPIGYASFPAYDARCRSWFQLAEKEADPAQAYFQYPRISSSGSYVLTGVVPIRTGNQLDGELRGVLNANFLMSTLSDAINSLTILQSGYSYLIDATNTSVVIVHPKASAACSFVLCVENFRPDEWTAFQSDFLEPIQAGVQVEQLSDRYSKRGRTWRLIVRRIEVGSVRYALMITVPNSEVLRASESTSDAIDTATNTMIAVFVVCLCIFACALLYLVRVIIQSVVTPINDLRDILEKALHEDYDCELADSASSLDMKLLLEAFAQLLVSLRFGSDSYAHGDQHRAKQVFTDALHVFTATHNLRGIGKSLNNLAAVEMALGNFPVAVELYGKAIESIQTLLTKQREMDGEVVTEEVQRLQHVLSDREGNLAVCYLEQGDFARAFALLERLLEDDKRSLYIKGCVVKQGSLGQYYLKQGEIQSAERVFVSSLSFIHGLQAQAQTRAKENSASAAQTTVGVTEEALSSPGDLDVALQIALYNMALLQEAKSKAECGKKKGYQEHKKGDSPNHVAGEDTSALEACYLRALVTPSTMHTSTVTKILLALHGIFHLQQSHRQQDLQELDALANEYDFHLSSSGTARGGKGGASADKAVAFLVDYSGSMSGAKIRSAVHNLDDMLTKYIHSADRMLLASFNGSVQTLVPLTVKQGHEDEMRRAIRSLTSPNGGTALYDALRVGLRALDGNTPSDTWVVALTDGQDNASSVKLPDLVREVAASKSSLIVIGVGSDVELDVLQQLTGASPKGTFVFAEGDQKSIDQAFQRVAAIIQGQVLLEEF